MARRTARPQPDQTLELPGLTRTCPHCGGPLWAAYKTRRSVTTLRGTVRLRLQVRRCRAPHCPRRTAPLRPEQEGRFALADTERLRRVTGAAGRVILASDGLQPDVGHEVLWVLRDCLSGEVLLAKSLLSSTQDALARLITEVKEALSVPIVGAVSDGQDSIRKAVKKALDGVPHQLCHFHYLREAAKPIFEADRHAKKELKKWVRGVRPIERKVEGRDDPEAKAIQG